MSTSATVQELELLQTQSPQIIWETKRKEMQLCSPIGGTSVLKIQLNMKVTELNTNKVGKRSERPITTNKESAVKSTG